MEQPIIQKLCIILSEALEVEEHEGGTCGPATQVFSSIFYYTCYIVPHSTLFSSMNITELPPQIRSIKLIQTNRKYQVFVFSKSIWNYQQIICFFAVIGEMTEILIFLILLNCTYYTISQLYLFHEEGSEFL